MADLSHQDWRKDPITQRLIAALNVPGKEPRFVGGCVRDALAGLPVVDIDLATPLQPDAVIQQLEQNGIKALPLGIDFGTVTAIIDSRKFEITSLRRDIKNDGRHPVVEYTEDWEEDAARRDFTINALYCDAQGKIYDFHDGLKDIEKGLVRFIGDPTQRIREDYLRILRFFRFHTRFGKGPPDMASLKACSKEAAMLVNLSGERVRDETFKLLSLEQAAKTWQTMTDQGLIYFILPTAKNTKRLQTVIDREKTLGMNDALRRLAAILNDGSDLNKTADKLKLSNEQKTRLEKICLVKFAVRESDALYRRDFYRDGADIILDRALLAPTDDYQKISTLAQNWQRPEFPIKGRDLIEQLKMDPGPAMGETLTAVENWWVEHDFKPDFDACIAQAKSGKSQARTV